MLYPTQAGFHRENWYFVDQVNHSSNWSGDSDVTTEAGTISLKTFISNLTDVASHRQIPAWNVIIKKLDFQSQMKISQQNQQLEDLVRENAEYELQKFRRHIKDDKYM